MGHVRSSKDNLLKRVKRIAGQIQAIERALDSDDDCSKTLLLVASTRGAINVSIAAFKCCDAAGRMYSLPGLYGLLERVIILSL
jgi:hypothetical protein